MASPFVSTFVASTEIGRMQGEWDRIRSEGFRTKGRKLRSLRIADGRRTVAGLRTRGMLADEPGRDRTEMSAGKHHDRAALLKDADYFAGELIRRVEQLAKIERSEQTYTGWKTSSVLTRRIRGFVRHQASATEGRA